MNIPRPNIKINKTWLMLIIAIVLSLLTTWLTMQYLRFKEQNMEAEITARTSQGRGETIAVVVPTRALPPGTLLDENMVASRNVPVDFVYDDTVTVAQFDAFKGQALLRDVERGKPLRRADVREVYADFSGTLKQGKRAMTINVDELNSIAHMVEPGNLVDLMLVVSSAGEGSSGSQTVAPFLDQVKVLATGQKVTHDDPAAQTGNGRRSYSNLTLEVTPAQAARLTLAMELGKIRAVLRNEKDNQSIDFDTVNADNLMEDIRERERRAALARPPRHLPGLPGLPGRAGSGQYVEYIIGGKGSDTVTPTINIPLPGGAETTPAAPVVPAQAVSAQTLADLIKLSSGAKPAADKSSK